MCASRGDAHAATWEHTQRMAPCSLLLSPASLATHFGNAGLDPAPFWHTDRQETTGYVSPPTIQDFWAISGVGAEAASPESSSRSWTEPRQKDLSDAWRR